MAGLGETYPAASGKEGILRGFDGCGKGDVGIRRFREETELNRIR
jgi:hypothetical protein